MSAAFGTTDLSELRVLVVDDEDDLRLGLERLVGRLGAKVRAAKDGVDALSRLEEGPCDVVVTDLKMPRMSGADLLARIRESRPETDVVIVTGYGTIQAAVACLQAGAAHFLTKPFDNDEVSRVVERLGRAALARRRGVASGPPPLSASPSAPIAGSEASSAREPLAPRAAAPVAPPDLGGLVAIDPTMLATLDLVDRAARTPAPVLLEGESGVGKELLARRLHEKSTVADRPFLAVNAAALPDTLLESELFGHKKGAFTGADRDRDGLFVAARGGTVFLDEVASMSPSFQGKLLRVLQERVVRPLGGTEDRRVEFRLVSASNKDLATLAAEGRFRDDLFYRLGVVVVKVPALRERPLDVEPLARRFLAEAAATCLAPSAPPPRLSQDALAALRAHRFPGNVRELRNAMQRAVVLVGDGPVEPSHLGLDLGATSKGLAQASGSLDYEEAKRRAVESFQREFVRRALSATNGNVSQAAERCGMTRAALQRILRRLDVDRADFDESS